jgi:uncharacterized protein YneF (UPF0154 family)
MIKKILLYGGIIVGAVIFHKQIAGFLEKIPIIGDLIRKFMGEDPRQPTHK